MAIRYREGRKAPYQVYWNNPWTGKRESASYTTKAEAEKEESLIKHRLRFDRDSFRRDEEPTGNTTTLEACYLAYLREKQFSRNNLAKQLAKMRVPLRRLGQHDIARIGRKELEELQAAMQQEPIKAVTIRGRMATLRAVMRWSADKGLCPQPEFPRLPQGQYSHFVPPTPEELRAIIAVAPQHIVRVVILGALFGVRVGPCELLGLTWDDVDFGRAVLTVHGSVKNANIPWREVPIRASLVGMLRQWQEEDAAQGVRWLIHYHGRQVACIKRAWRTTLSRAGISRRIRLYDLRHAFATQLIAAGVDVGTVSKLMGHSNPNMVWRHYQHVLDSQKRQAMDALPDLQDVPRSMCPK